MTDVEIRVQGSHSVKLPPEQATVHGSVRADGPDPEPVVRLVAAVLSDVTASLASRHDADRGPVTRYAVEQIRKNAYRPYNQDGAQLPTVHAAAASFTATFTDFDELGAWATRAAGLGGVEVGHISWTLTDDRQRAVERDARQEAVRDARRRAQDYADALDLGPVQVRTVGDPGLSGPGEPRAKLARAMADASGPGAEITLRPDDVEVSAYVEATFTATR